MVLPTVGTQVKQINKDLNIAIMFVFGVHCGPLNRLNPSEDEQITMSAVTNEAFEKVENCTVLRQDDIQSLVATPPSHLQFSP